MFNRLITVFFVAAGVVLGGAFIGGIAALFTRESPFKLMWDVSQRLRLYAVVSSIGGTFANLRLLEGGLFQGEFSIVLQQVFVLLSGFLGSYVGVWVIKVLTGNL